MTLAELQTRLKLNELAVRVEQSGDVHRVRVAREDNPTEVLAEMADKDLALACVMALLRAEKVLELLQRKRIALAPTAQASLVVWP